MKIFNTLKQNKHIEGSNLNSKTKMNEEDKSKLFNSIINKIKINPVTQCWDYQGFINENGYGRIQYMKKSYYVHRLMYFLYYDKPMEGIVMHLCNNPLCCNPFHLKHGTILENNQYKSITKRTPKKKLAPQQVLEIKLLLKYKHNFWQIVKTYKVSPNCINRIKDGKTWKNVNLIEKEPYDPFDDIT